MVKNSNFETLYKICFPSLCLDTKNLLTELSINDHPVGMGGCKSNHTSYDCCEYDITIFDGKKQKESVLAYDGTFCHIYHGELEEMSPAVLLQYHNMVILSDEQWELRMLLSKVNEKKKQIFNAYVKNSLVEANVCVTKTKNGLGTDMYASSWLKCAVYFLADAISAINFQRPSPTHMLKTLREFDKNKTNELVSILTETIGIERATPSLLSRMTKSTMGFSDMIENNHHSKIISQKSHYMKTHSMLSDCYFYLGYINRNNFIKISELHRKPEFIHILKTAFDLENDTTKIESLADNLQKMINSLLSSLHE
tara:strand:- start:2618 stop:3550 length:933 start_codon:yes stop_codon:yes gene_type:complete